MLSSLFSLLAFAAAADLPYTGTFSLITIHSGSNVQYQPVKLSSDGHLSLNGETDLELGIDPEGRLYANTEHVSLYQGAPIVTPGVWDGARWAIVDGHLELMSSEAFVVCPEINNNIMFAKYGTPSNCANPIGVSLKVIDN